MPVINDKLTQAGLIKTTFWLTPLEVRVVRASLDALRAHADAGLLQKEIETREATKDLLSRYTMAGSKPAKPQTILLGHPPVRLSTLGLPTRTVNALRGAGIVSVDQVSAMHESDLLQIPDLGRKGIRELLDACAARS